MKPVQAAFALTLTLAFAAGCLTTPPAQTSTTTTPAPDDSTPLTTVTHPGGGALIRPAHEENSSDQFTLVGDESTSGIYPPGEVTFHFVGTNDGPTAEVLFDPCGAGNPRIWIEDENGTRLSLQPPQVHCMAAMGFGPMAHAASVEANLTWNGTAYNGDKPYVAPAGLYHAIGVFEARRNGAIVDVQVSLPFSIVSDRGML